MLTCCWVPRSLLLLLAESCAVGAFVWLVWLPSCHGMPHVIRIDVIFDVLIAMAKEFILRKLQLMASFAGSGQTFAETEEG
ncbi:UNVERIFIED_CONTAM: hypothetical protein K2H54_046481 [Gekko kuhli]